MGRCEVALNATARVNRCNTRDNCMKKRPVKFTGRLLTDLKHDQSNALRALTNMCNHALLSAQSSGCQLICAVRNTRSGCGIMMVARPSVDVTPAMACGEPFGFSG